MKEIINKIQRILDIFLVLGAMPVAFPIMALISLLIASKCDGPVLFCQQRIGRFKKPFTIYKFRTMFNRKPEQINQFQEGVLTTGVDPRVTQLGRILRATSLDELPQLFNVLNGSMSMIGPRPLIPEQLLAVPPKFGKRFLVRPGITGWAQINGRRSLDWLKQLELDAWYATHNNLMLNLQILMKTLGIVFQGSGTYGSVKNNWRSYLPVNQKR